MVQAERQIATTRTRSFIELTSFSEQEKSNLVLCSDVEGPFFLGDFINEAMSERVRPASATRATPTHGELIYQRTWKWFTDITLNKRGISPYSQSSVSQEGEDTLFTLPLLLASGVTEQDLTEMTLRSNATPGSVELVRELEREGALIVGITTAPQEPYRRLVSETGLLPQNKIIGSPFPLDDFRTLLEGNGLLEEENRITNEYLTDCFNIIDSHSTISTNGGTSRRVLSTEGEEVLQSRIERFHSAQLGLSYEVGRRNLPRRLSASGQVIEANRIVGDRAKSAIANQVGLRYRTDSGVLVTEGDGLNDTLMLQRAPISIGLNGADAARAAKIGVVTSDRRSELPIFEAIISGERNLDKIVSYAQSRAGSTAIIHKGGPNTDAAILVEHRKMKKALRGEIIY